MSLKLTFVPESTAITPGFKRLEKAFTGKDATEILDQWNKLPSWNSYDGLNFRLRLIEFSGAPIELPQDDPEILAAAVEALGPRVVTLEDTTTPTERLVKRATE